MLVSQLCWHSYILQTDVAATSSNPTLILGLVAVVAIAFGGFYLLKQQKKVSLDPMILKNDFIQNQASEIGEAAIKKVDEVLDEYQKILPYMEELGLKINGLSIEAGLFPKLKTSLVASLDVIEMEAVERIKEENKTNKLLVAILTAILLAKKCDDRLDEASVTLFKDLVVDIELGIPPAISVRFQ